MDPKIDQQFLPSSIIPLSVNFLSIVPENNLNDLDDQWRNYRANAGNLQIASYSIPSYWYLLKDIKDGLGNNKYGMLSEFMTTLTILPHSSAAVERIFSLMNHVKTKQTSSLNASTVRDRILAKQSITRGNKNCISWSPSKALLTDVLSGSVSQRYKQRVADSKETVTLEANIEGAQQ